MLKSKEKIFLALCVCLLVVGVGGAFMFTSNSPQSSTPAVTTPEAPSVPEAAPESDSAPETEPAPEVEAEPAPEPEPEPEVEAFEFNLLGVGDDLIHDGIYIQAGERSATGYDFTYVYAEVADYVANADIASINQETMLASSYAPSGYPMFNSPPDLGHQLVDLGFDVFNLANNHMFDKGQQGLLETMDLLRGYEGTVVTGAYYDHADYLDIPTIEVEGVTIAFVGTTQLTNGLNLPSGSTMSASITTSTSDFPEFLAQVERATEISDIVVANIHWGSEYTHTPSAFQTSLAAQAIDAGVDVILGHHPHVIQPVDYHTRPDGTMGVVCYSLGNFVSAQHLGPRMIGGMLDVTFLVEGDDVSLKDVRFLPVITHYDANYTNIRIYPYDRYTAALAASHGVRSNTSDFSHSYIHNTITSVIAAPFLPDDYGTYFPY